MRDERVVHLEQAHHSVALAESCRLETFVQLDLWCFVQVAQGDRPPALVQNLGSADHQASLKGQPDCLSGRRIIEVCQSRSSSPLCVWEQGQPSHSPLDLEEVAVQLPLPSASPFCSASRQALPYARLVAASCSLVPGAHRPRLYRKERAQLQSRCQKQASLFETSCAASTVRAFYASVQVACAFTALALFKVAQFLDSLSHDRAGSGQGQPGRLCTSRDPVPSIDVLSSLWVARLRGCRSCWRYLHSDLYQSFEKLQSSSFSFIMRTAQ